MSPDTLFDILLLFGMGCDGLFLLLLRGEGGFWIYYSCIYVYGIRMHGGTRMVGGVGRMEWNDLELERSGMRWAGQVGLLVLIDNRGICGQHHIIVCNSRSGHHDGREM